MYCNIDCKVLVMCLLTNPSMLFAEQLTRLPKTKAKALGMWAPRVLENFVILVRVC
jgi:hypothetical protein